MLRPVLWALLTTLFALAGIGGGTAQAGAGAVFPAVDPSFAGISLHQQTVDLSQSAWPPSPNGAVGPTHVLEAMNQSVAIYTRSGTRLQHVRLRDFLSVSSHGITYQATFDPRVVFDAASQRWFVACVGSGAGTNPLPDPVILAVSRSADPTGSWSKFLVPLGEAAVGGEFRASANLTLGVDGMGVYFGVRIVPETSAAFCKLAATPKASLVANRPSLGKLTQFGPFTGVVASPQPGVALDQSGGANTAWAVATPADANADLRWWKITWSRSTPTLSASGNLSTPSFGAPPDASQSGSATPIETGDERLQSNVIRNGNLWTCRTIGVNSSGAAGGADRTACEWLELSLASGTPALVQSGRVFDSGSSPRFYYFPTISANSSSGAVLSFCGSSSTEFIGAYYTSRYAADAAGTMSDVQTLKSGEATYVRTVGNGQMPFGRYGTVCIDPVDDFSFWSIQPYAALTPTPDSWGTWIARILLAEPPIPPGEARISPLSLKFSKVKIGKSKTKSFTITSRGDDPLIGTVQGATAPYTVTTGAGDFHLTHNQKLKVSVQFSPTVKGAAPPATVTVTTNDPERPVVSITLTGTGK